MRLSEIKGVDAIDVIADIVDPIVEIFSDEEVVKSVRAGKPEILIAKVALKRQKKAVLEVLAILNRQDPEDFNPSLIELPLMLMDLIKDINSHKELKDLFTSQGQNEVKAFSGPATQNTTETETM